MTTLNFNCEHCQQPIAPEDGALFITHTEIEKALQRSAAQKQAAVAAGDKDISLDQHLALPQSGAWQHMHRSCMEELGLSAVYSIPLTRLNNYKHLVAWFVHLQEKSWQPGSNFVGIMAESAPELPA